jgi:hypothetical protein
MRVHQVVAPAGGISQGTFGKSLEQLRETLRLQVTPVGEETDGMPIDVLNRTLRMATSPVP